MRILPEIAASTNTAATKLNRIIPITGVHAVSRRADRQSVAACIRPATKPIRNQAQFVMSVILPRHRFPCDQGTQQNTCRHQHQRKTNSRIKCFVDRTTQKRSADRTQNDRPSDHAQHIERTPKTSMPFFSPRQSQSISLDRFTEIASSSLVRLHHDFPVSGPAGTSP